ncbi:tRNA (adenosine(37)-N6)-threonylcarbamoyltransferase complex ATPase subunit type 1 TsaE [Enterococcus ureilyticus]|uniref:tRNA threonylcarbamoyladenosine biosynthesis protein TsaE n=1 Tax=Enterococcus ureilyticus TaxID=1131292 RepID=A0A1E5HEE2_9ENTE|nr:tRNA (adenosine(37)-N6)-threonylcarbamoyltransferase complex ATPase subunit type 1 TsaE [Enterococcus ureilyticus]MBM7689557.1 tRNA threonylcarbamoyladenosine biosynthesis protein TsaE [Enterococcus ureilyticus]MBO0446233.1 tRNA (adenosine(37)-N6)-threonylcarbamoyltransferase complex ATPase subunit type 1 TsaE [Enterococcus ureilyticus]OEG23309.1 tRNA (adenosine(37)-N6)-threonylcarbamoyltransferase complex ATPase subunit type 1 TsaE [Enterococcus ureilyticus]
MDIMLNNPKETEGIAKIIGSVAAPGDTIILSGDLGAGKTTMTKGIAVGLGIDQMIKSPTYTIIREYQQGRLPLYHMDVYRIEHGADDLGLDEYFEGDGLSVVEWGKLLGEFLPTDYLDITITKDSEDMEKRIVSFQAIGTQAERFLERIHKKMEDHV